MSTTEIQFIDEALRPIAQLCDGEVSNRAEGNASFIHMQNLRFFVKGVEHMMDALLCLNYHNPSYPTKLYFSSAVGAGLNWHETAYILGRTWHTYSWAGVAANQRPIEILAAHLAALN